MKDEFYEFMTKAKEKPRKNGLCSSCFCVIAKRCLKNFGLENSYFGWKAKK